MTTLVNEWHQRNGLYPQGMKFWAAPSGRKFMSVLAWNAEQIGYVGGNSEMPNTSSDWKTSSDLIGKTTAELSPLLIFLNIFYETLCLYTWILYVNIWII